MKFPCFQGRGRGIGKGSELIRASPLLQGNSSNGGRAEWQNVDSE